MLVLLLASILAVANADVGKPQVFKDGEYSGSSMTDNAAMGEQGKYFEGDMILNPEQMEALFEADSRNGLINVSQRWPDRTVVYQILPGHFSQQEVNIITNALADISSKTCIKFRPRQGQEHAVVIKSNEGGCFAQVGYNPRGEQPLNLDRKGCIQHGVIIHEMLHTLGFYHMQSTYDRDNFVRILYQNIEDNLAYNFDKYEKNVVTDFGVPYDYGSIMHYPENAFSKNGQKTIVPLQPNVQIGQRQGMSQSDVRKLNQMYKC